MIFGVWGKMKQKIYDCIVIGAGIAGLMAARELEKRGVDYICIDKKRKIGYPLKCGEGVCQKTFDRFFPGDYPFVKNKIIKNRFLVFTKNRVAQRVLKIPFYQVDRPRFEQWLAKDVGRKIKLDSGCEDVERTKEGWRVKTKKGSYKTKTVILAHGCNFFIQKKLGMVEKNPALGVHYVGIFKNARIREDEFLYAYNQKKLMGFWAFPKGRGVVNAGVGYIRLDNDKKINLKTVFNDFTKKIRGLEDIKAVEIRGGVEPLSGPIEKTYTEGLLAAGDAAGFTYAFSGEGIKYALVSGWLSGRTISKAIKINDTSDRSLSRYEKVWKKEFGGELKCGIVLKDIALWVYHRHPNLVERLFMKPSEKDLDMVKKGILPLKTRVLYGYIKTRKRLDKRYLK